MNMNMNIKERKSKKDKINLKDIHTNLNSKLQKTNKQIITCMELVSLQKINQKE